MLKIAMLSTGEEVLHGDITDTNAAWLSELFFAEGFELYKRSTVGDNCKTLAEELLMLSLNSDVLIVNGGLGPTSDDLTAEIAAEVSEQPLVRFDAWITQMEAFFSRRGKTMADSNIKQAMLPEQSTMLDNPIGTACGFRLTINDCECYFTPGVPTEFKKMVVEQIVPDLQQRFPEQVGQACHRIYTFGSSESELAGLLESVPLPEGYQLGYRSYVPFIEIKLFGPKNDQETAFAVIQNLHKPIMRWVVSIDKPMIEFLSDCVSESNLTISLAEEATGGWMTNWYSEQPSLFAQVQSSWVIGSSLAERMKEQASLAAVLGLSGATRSKNQSDIGVATGRYDEGQFAVAISTPDGEWGQTLAFNRQYSNADRKCVISTIVSDMLLRYLTKKPIFRDYSSLTQVKQLYIPASQLPES